jgi:hypothetical protein
MNANSHEMSPDEEYANAYHYFIKSLRILAQEAGSQCKSMDYFNVAWELKDDVSRGATAVLSLHSGHLSEEQTTVILQMLKELASIPTELLNVTNVRMEQIHAMNHPAWDVIRTHAKDILRLLGPETKRIEAVLYNANT